jgi:hypothetical protein
MLAPVTQRASFEHRKCDYVGSFIAAALERTALFHPF